MAAMDDELESFVSEPMSDALRLAGIKAMVGDAAGLPPLTSAEAIALYDGFLRARRDSGAPFLSIELRAVINWGQRARIDGLLLDNLREAAIGIDLEGPDVLFCAPPGPESFSAASALVATGDDPDLDCVQLAFAAVRWADGRPTSAIEREAIAQWARIAVANNALLDAFVDSPAATIDYDARGRVVIYPPERH